MNIPNLLSIFRIVLVPVFVAVFFGAGAYSKLYAVGIFLLAGLSDMIDGHLARKLGQITLLGRILDPLADKLMVLAALACGVAAGYIPLWAVVLFAAKESAQGLLGLLLFRRIKEVPAANVIGKTGTVLFYITIAASIVWGDMPAALKCGMLAVSLACAMSALVSYVIRGARLSRQIGE